MPFGMAVIREAGSPDSTRSFSTPADTAITRSDRSEATDLLISLLNVPALGGTMPASFGMRTRLCLV